MGWILLALLILDWIVMFIKLFQGVKELKRFETTREGDASNAIKQFLIFLLLGIIITLAIIVYSILV